MNITLLITDEQEPSCLINTWKVGPVNTEDPSPARTTPIALYFSFPVLKLENINAHFEATLQHNDLIHSHYILSVSKG